MGTTFAGKNSLSFTQDRIKPCVKYNIPGVRFDARRFVSFGYLRRLQGTLLRLLASIRLI